MQPDDAPGLMHPETTGSALLDIAQKTLAEEIAPLLPPEKRYVAAMIGSAMRMAAREFEQRDRIESVSQALAGTSAEEARALIGAIRTGVRDADSELHTLLWADAAVRASVAKPSLLTRVERRLAGMPDQDD